MALTVSWPTSQVASRLLSIFESMSARSAVLLLHSWISCNGKCKRFSLTWNKQGNLSLV